MKKCCVRWIFIVVLDFDRGWLGLIPKILRKKIAFFNYTNILTSSAFTCFLNCRGHVTKQQDIQCICNVTLRCDLRQLLLWESNENYTTWVCVCICCSRKFSAWNVPAPVISSVACSALQKFPTLSHKRYNFRPKKNIVNEHKMCVLIFSTRFVLDISHSKKKRVRYEQKLILVFI